MTTFVAALAPRIAGWPFYPAKQPKNWHLRFTMEDVNGEVVKVDASAWRYALLKRDDDMYDVVFEPPDLRNLPGVLRQDAAEIVLDGEIGEYLRIKHICDIEVVDKFDERLAGRDNSISVLRDHFRRIVSD